jgi:hypothetical protein
METGGVPADLSPYLPIPFYYHFGFHLAAALFAFWGRFSPAEAVLILGQILNAAIFLSIYRLGMALWGDQGRSLLAALLVGFVSQMPAYYAAWGRYTLLTGLVLLPVAMAVALEIKEGLANKQGMILMGIFVSGLVLTHYFAAFLFLLFWIIRWGFSIQAAYSLKKPSVEANRLLIGLGLGLLLISPWIYRVLDYGWRYLRLKIVSPSQSLDQTYFSDYCSYLLYLLGPWRNTVLIFLAFLGLRQVWRSKGGREFVLWTFLLVLGVIPWGVRLIPFRPDHLAIVLFIPVSLLAGWSLSRLIAKWKKVGLILTLVFLLWGLVGTWNLIKPETILADRADLQAINWIKGNIPKEARFLINVTSWAWGTYRGVDGGAWITPLTGRWTSLPPIFYGFGGRAYASEINQLAARVSRLTGCTTAFWDLARENGLTHIYLKYGQGSLIPEAFWSCPGLELVYARNGIFIFSLL